MVKKIIIPIVAAVMAAVVAVGAAVVVQKVQEEQRNCYDIITVYVKEEYKDSFLSKEIAIEDFDYEDIESIVYLKWIEISYPYSHYGPMHVHLKTNKKEHAQAAVEHFKTLNFVETAMIESEKMYSYFVVVYINETKRVEYRDKNIKTEDFGHENIERIEYFSGFIAGSKSAIILIHLKEKGARKVLEAVEQFSTLDFVIEASPALK